MLNRSRRDFVVAACASLLYGARRSFAIEAPGTATRIGVLLPLNSQSFGRAADAVKRGIETAARASPDGALAVTVYSTTEDPANVAAGYTQALAEAPGLIVGPLTRNGVTALLQQAQPGTPVLALNVPEGNTPLPPDFYAFSLHVEAEAKQVAQMAFGDGRRSALTLTGEHPLAQRIQRAFSDEFVAEGGSIVAKFAYRNSVPDLLALREAATGGACDAVFLALDAAHARLVRGYVNGPAQLYATSQIQQGAPDPLRDAELNGIRFLGMPWFLQPDHPAVMLYSGASGERPAASDLERLYAFGIDAYRLAGALVRGADLARDPLDGVTGRIRLAADRRFQRQLTPAQFVEGRAVPLATTP